MGTLEGVEGQYITETKHEKGALPQQNEYLAQNAGIIPSINQAPESARDVNEEEDAAERHVKLGDSAEENGAQQKLKK